MSHIYFVLGVIGWSITPIVVLAYLLWPAGPNRRGFEVVPADSKEKSFP